MNDGGNFLKYALCTMLSTNNEYANELCCKNDNADIIITCMMQNKAIISFIELTEEEYYKILNYLN